MLKNIFRLSLLYAVIEGSQKGVLFLLTPIITKSMSAEEYGLVSSGLMAISFLSVVCGLCLHGSLTRYYYKYKGKERDAFISTLFLFLLAILGFSFLLLMVMGKELFSVLLPEVVYSHFLLCIFLVAVSQPVVVCFLSLLKVQQDIRKYFYYYSGYFFTQTTLLMLLVVCLHHEADGYVQALAISNLAFAGGAVALLFKQVSFDFNWGFIPVTFKYALTVLPTSLLGLVNNLVDRYYILMFVGLTGVGKYYLGVQICGLINMALLAINNAYAPLFLKQAESTDKDFGRFYLLGDVIVFFAASIGLFVSLFAPYFIEFFFIKAYWEVEDFLVFLIYSSAILGIYFINTNVLALDVRLARLKPVIVFCGLVLNVILSWVMTQQYGLQGASISTLLSTLFITLFYVVLVKRKTLFCFNSLLHLAMMSFSFLLALEAQFFFIKEGAYSAQGKILLLCVFLSSALLLLMRNYFLRKGYWLN